MEMSLEKESPNSGIFEYWDLLIDQEWRLSLDPPPWRKWDSEKMIEILEEAFSSGHLNPDSFSKIVEKLVKKFPPCYREVEHIARIFANEKGIFSAEPNQQNVESLGFDNNDEQFASELQNEKAHGYSSKPNHVSFFSRTQVSFGEQKSDKQQTNWIKEEKEDQPIKPPFTLVRENPRSQIFGLRRPVESFLATPANEALLHSIFTQTSVGKYESAVTGLWVSIIDKVFSLNGRDGRYSLLPEFYYLVGLKKDDGMGFTDLALVRTLRVKGKVILVPFLLLEAKKAGPLWTGTATWLEAEDQLDNGIEAIRKDSLNKYPTEVRTRPVCGIITQGLLAHLSMWKVDGKKYIGEHSLYKYGPNKKYVLDVTSLEKVVETLIKVKDVLEEWVMDNDYDL